MSINNKIKILIFKLITNNMQFVTETPSDKIFETYPSC